MKPGKLFLLPLTLSALSGPGMVFAQNSSELDVTISVMQEGETPAGFINRLELPAVELIEPQPQPTLTEQNISATVESISEQAEDATETVTNAIREVLSIDGNGSPEPTEPGSGPVTDIIENLPDQVVDILDPALPLDDTLEDVIDTVTDPVGDVVDTVTDPVEDVVDTVTDPVDGIVDTLDDTTTDVLDTTEDLVQDTTGNLDAAVTETVETVDQSVLEPLDETVTEVLDETAPEDAGLDDAGILDNAAEQMSIDEITDELPGL